MGPETATNGKEVNRQTIRKPGQRVYGSNKRMHDWRAAGLANYLLAAVQYPCVAVNR